MKKFITILTIATVALFGTLTSCTDEEKDKVKEITGLTFLDGDRIILWEGDSKTIQAVIEPADASTLALLAMVQWTTSNPNVISVDAGVITVVGSGTAVVTATLMGETASCTVIVPMAGLTTINRAETRIQLFGTGTAAIDWADGTAPQIITLSSAGTIYERANPAGIEKQILITGGEGIMQMNVLSLISHLRLSSNQNLTHLRCANVGLHDGIRLGNCPALIYVDVSQNSLSMAVADALVDMLPTYPAYSGTGTINFLDNVEGLANLRGKAELKGWAFAEPQFVVLPAIVTIPKGESQQFTVQLGSQVIPAEDVDWVLIDKETYTNTFIYDSGLMIVAPDETQTTFTVRATYKYNSSMYAEAIVTVQ
ncbi:MAG: hypothetical protein LBH22_00590 [Bacteroidales bacterium]|jgi:hypothetical protein|nr:hypothetical protein [Bacteroidales bacterium]